MITIDSEIQELAVDVSPEDLNERLKDWSPPEQSLREILAKYARSVSSASKGAITD
ncbi:dihydroxy-acid dehydratase [Alkalihalobacterium alkalinitrilicum]|uniref:dihydroxy-acid dehydratase domain-containing protein n=1 Tax=Alkalihalobacterium alkalinitrilicum TaxID=427920 RepID=UPI001152F597|nr:dihydroxy-acid dehydratase [Alkalihalobacterium alkalinitrilicum]